MGDAFTRGDPSLQPGMLGPVLTGPILAHLVLPSSSPLHVPSIVQPACFSHQLIPKCLAGDTQQTQVSPLLYRLSNSSLPSRALLKFSKGLLILSL